MHSRQQPKQAIAIMPPKAEAPKDADGASAAGTSSAVTSPNTPSIATHPSATAAPIAEEPQRPSARERPPANTWTSLDMGGVGIKHLAPGSGVFAYAFLVTLYLNHNQLSAVPGVIGRLRHLELLDLSGNQLSSVPPELGMLTRLKELYLFDNNLPRIPHELGTLHQLQTLGVEGNPLDANQMGLIQKEGTAALIAHLRDTCPLPLPPPDRVWVSAVPPAEQAALADNPDVERFTVLSYNILCEKAATEKMYGYTATWALKWEYRKGLILKEILHHNADFVCLQEVDQNQYEGHLVPALTFGDDAEYESVYFPKGRHRTMSTEESKLVDGCAIFYRKSK
jgi:CCR4-NOT transcription complex subunit 6